MNTSDNGTYHDRETGVRLCLVRTGLAGQNYANQLKRLERKDGCILWCYAIARQRWSNFGKGQPLYRSQANGEQCRNNQCEDGRFQGELTLKVDLILYSPRGIPQGGIGRLNSPLSLRERGR